MSNVWWDITPWKRNWQLIICWWCIVSYMVICLFNFNDMWFWKSLHLILSIYPIVLINKKNYKCIADLSVIRFCVKDPPQLVYITPLLSGDGFQCEADANPKATLFSWKRYVYNGCCDSSSDFTSLLIYLAMLFTVLTLHLQSNKKERVWQNAE